MQNRKIALVTGGSRGLGKNAAIALEQKGIDVLLTYNSNKADADETVSIIESNGGKAFALQLSVSDTKGFDAFVAATKQALSSHFNCEHFDFLINNAGIGIHKSFEATTEEDFDTLMNIQFKSPFFLTQKLLPLINDGGSIINISSGLARFALPGYAAYAAMKGAMETLTRYQAKELGSRGIRVNIVAPGAIETDFGGGVVRDNEAMNKGIAARTALGRVGLPDDIGGLIATLCLPEMGWVNAQRIEASGGMFL